MIACGYAPAGLEQLDDLLDAGLLLVERRIPQPPLHVPGQVELAGALGEQVMRDAGLVRAGAAEERPGVDGELAAAPRAQVRRAEPAARAAADEDGVVLPVILVRRGDVPQSLGVVPRVRDDVVDQQRPLAHGQRSAIGPRSPFGQRPERRMRARSAVNPSPGFRTSIIAGPPRHRVRAARARSTAADRLCAGQVTAGRRTARASPRHISGRAEGPGRRLSGQASSRKACSVPQARVASCRLKCTSGSLSSSPVRSRIRCSRYFSVLLCTDSSAAVAS